MIAFCRAGPRAASVERVEVRDQVTAVGIDLHQAGYRTLLGGRVIAERRGAGGQPRFRRPLGDGGLHRVP